MSLILSSLVLCCASQNIGKEKGNQSLTKKKVKNKDISLAFFKLEPIVNPTGEFRVDMSRKIKGTKEWVLGYIYRYTIENIKTGEILKQGSAKYPLKWVDDYVLFISNKHYQTRPNRLEEVFKEDPDVADYKKFLENKKNKLVKEKISEQEKLLFTNPTVIYYEVRNRKAL